MTEKNVLELESGDDKIEITKAPASFKSSVWRTFGFALDEKNNVKKDETICRLCKMRIKYTGSTTNMSTHLRRHHPEIDCQLNLKSEPESKSLKIDTNTRASTIGQLRLSEAFKSKLSSRSTRAQAITNAIGTFIAMDMRPYSVVENTGFKHLINTLEPRYEIPSRTHFTNYVLPELYKTEKACVMKSISSASSMALTTDGWTSRATESYITITAHYINDEWQLENPVLQTRPLHESHTGANLANVLEGAVDEWKLTGFSQISITTDNASNIVSAIQQSIFAPHIRCFAHTVNLASQKAMQVPQMSRILGRVRRVVSFFHRSTHAASVLKSKQSLLEMPHHKLIQDVATRWNSSYDMLERYLEQQAAIFATLTQKDIRKNADSLVTLSDEDVTGVEEATVVLKPLKTITTILCNEKAPTVSLIQPLKQLILKSMTEREGDSTMIKAIKSAIAKDLIVRYTDAEVNMFLQEATALDPRFRSLPYCTDEERLQVYTRLTVQAVKQASLDVQVKVKTEPEPEVPPLPVIPDAPSPEPAVGASTSGAYSDSESADTHTATEPPLKKPKSEMPEKSAMEEIFGEVFITSVQKGKPLGIQIEEEISKYKIEPCIPLTENPLHWWRVNSVTYPHLSHLARRYLGIPATSVPSERVFSTAGDIVTAQRASLSPDNVDVLIFLKKNLKF